MSVEIPIQYAFTDSLNGQSVEKCVLRVNDRTIRQSIENSEHISILSSPPSTSCKSDSEQWEVLQRQLCCGSGNHPAPLTELQCEKIGFTFSC